MLTHKLLEILALSLIAVSSSNAATYNLAEHIVGNDFYDEFTFQTFADPTRGRVNFVSQTDAQARNLSFATDDTFIMRADFTTTLDPSGPGRDSIRIQSKKAFDRHVLIMDIRHMPEGCATWPAAWEVGTISPWPMGGEIDIVEGANGISPNQATLHTNPGCTMPENTAQTGTFVTSNCDAKVDNNVGCGVQVEQLFSFGHGFNINGGGWYAMERAQSEIRVWFWDRNDGSVPNDVKNAPTSIDTSTWNTPFADFSSTSCDIDTFFEPQNIIFDLTLCGDFAGSVFPLDGCGSDCNSFVNNNPSAFANAFWDVASVNVFQ